MVVTFEDKEQLEFISNFVNLVSGIYDHSAVSTISILAGRLAGLLAATKDKPDDIQLTIDLTEDPTDNHDNDQLYCLYNMCGVLNSIGADEVNAVIDMYIVLKKHYTKSDVPRFLEMLKEYHVPAEYCVDLFSDWCSGEGLAGMAEKCMDIQAKYNIIMTPVWNWICKEEYNPDTDWHKEVNKYKEAINGRTE